MSWTQISRMPSMLGCTSPVAHLTSLKTIHPILPSSQVSSSILVSVIRNFMTLGLKLGLLHVGSTD